MRAKGWLYNTQRAPWHNCLETCQVLTFLLFFWDSEVWGGRDWQIRVTVILRGKGEKGKEKKVNNNNTGEKEARERGNTLQTQPSLALIVSSLVRSTEGRCSAGSSERQTPALEGRGHNMRDMGL